MAGRYATINTLAGGRGFFTAPMIYGPHSTFGAACRSRTILKLRAARRRTMQRRRTPTAVVSRRPLATSDDSNTPHDAGYSRRVLIVDDNVDSAETLVQVVRGWGHEVKGPVNDLSAGERANRFGLPGMTGYEVARPIRGNSFHHDLHLFAITGYGREED